MCSLVPTLLCERVESHLNRLHLLSRGLRSVTFSDVASFDPAHGTIHLVREHVDKNCETLEAVGCSIAHTAVELAKAVEAQLTEFFAHFKRKESESILSVLSGPLTPPEGNREAAREVSRECDFGVLSPPRSVVDPVAGKDERIPASHQKPQSLYCADLRAGAVSLKTCLFLMMESLLTRVMGCRAVLYLRTQSWDSVSLRRVIHINAHHFPREVYYSETPSLAAVIEERLAINIKIRSACTNSSPNAQSSGFRPFNGRGHSSITIHSGIVFPLADSGCIIITSKYPDATHHFSVPDEYQVWAFASVAEGLLSRYHPAVLLDAPSVSPQKVPESCARLPSISTHLHAPDEQGTSNHDLMAIAEMLPPVARTMKIMRVTRVGRRALRTAGKSYDELSYTDMLRDVGEHVRSLEEAHGKLSAKLYNMKQRADKAEGELNGKKQQQDKLESDIRFMNALLEAEGIRTPRH